jgi:chromosome segregation ATPase
VQQLKVKLLLSETEQKTQIEQAQKILQEAVSAATSQVQLVQRQIQEEQEGWKKAIEGKDAELRQLQGDVRARLRQLEADYAQRLATLSGQKEELTQHVGSLDEQYKSAQQLHEERMRRFRSPRKNISKT